MLVTRTREVLRQARLAYYDAAGVPRTTNCPEFEEIFFDLGRDLPRESPLVARLLEEITDDEVIHQKGEGPEIVLEQEGKLLPRRGAIQMNKHFIARRVELVREAIPDIESRSLVDVGASSDLIFRYLGHRGLGINISPAAVEYMAKQGLDARLGDAECLELESESFDVALCFQTIEHLENPARCLRELARVSRDRIFITIPHTLQTRVCPWEPNNRGRHRWHFIEFSPADFEKVLARVGLEVRRREIIRSWGEPRTHRERQFVRRFARHPWLLGFVFYELVRTS